MKVIATRNFLDLEKNVKRGKGEEFIISKDRFEEINAKFPELVKEVKSDKKEK